MDNINLIGAEEVHRASIEMQSASEDFLISVANMSETLERFNTRFEDTVKRLEELLMNLEKLKVL